MPFFLFRENVGWEQLTQDTEIEKTNAFAIEANTGPMSGYSGLIEYNGAQLSYANLELPNGDMGEVRQADVTPTEQGWFHSAERL
jgi:hypothetical protein